MDIILIYLLIIVLLFLIDFLQSSHRIDHLHASNTALKVKKHHSDTFNHS